MSNLRLTLLAAERAQRLAVRLVEIIDELSIIREQVASGLIDFASLTKEQVEALGFASTDEIQKFMAVTAEMSTQRIVANSIRGAY